MNNSLLIAAGLMVVGFGTASAAHAQDPALGFDLPAQAASETVRPEVQSDEPLPAEVAAMDSDAADPLEVPSYAADAPTGYTDEQASLPPPPSDPLPVEPEPPIAAVAQEPEPAASSNGTIELAFEPPTDPEAAQLIPPTQASAPAPTATDGGVLAFEATQLTLDKLFTGGPDSLVALAVGNAEGTRTATGQKTPGYYGHRDPGNGAWNQGSFSYQHSAASPEEADTKQLDRLRQQAEVMQQKAQTAGISLTLAENLNGIDLANQAPKAALDREGYVDWLARAHQNGKRDSDAILWARVQSFINPATQQWDAPGLGNSQESILHDQERRMRAIDRAIASYQKQQIAAAPPPLPEPTEPPTIEPVVDQETIAHPPTEVPLAKSPIPVSAPSAVAAAPAESTPQESAAVQQILDLDLSAL